MLEIEKNKYETSLFSNFLVENEEMPELIVELNGTENKNIRQFLERKGIEVVGINEEKEEGCLEASFITIKKKPIFIYRDTVTQINEVNCNDTFNEKIKTIITDLPSKKEDIFALAYACNYLKVVVATYGNVEDDDYEEKLRRLYLIKKIFKKYSIHEIVSKRNFKDKDLYMEYITNRVRKK